MISLFVIPAACWGANHYVRPGATGTGSGTDWTNAYPNLPSTLVRGDTYYLADGSYGSHTFNDVNGGTALITIVKATPSSHGTDTGWSGAFGASQAAFSHWNIYADYYVFNGATRNSDWRLGTLSQYGIKVSGSGPVRLDNGFGAGGDNLTFSYVDFRGGGTGTGTGDDVIYGLTGNSNITFQNCALHDSDRTIFLMRGNWQNLKVDHCYIARNTSTPAIHGEMLSMTDSTGAVFSNNVIEDVEGTAVFVGLNNGTASDWQVYGNTVRHTSVYVTNQGNPGETSQNYGLAGFVFIANDSSQINYGNNWSVYNNTLYNIQGTYSGVIIQSGTGNLIKNNIWYNSVTTNNSGATFADNWYYNTASGGDTSGTSVTCTANCNIFVDPSSNNFHLVKNTASGLSLAAPFNLDPDGILRGIDGVWDRGAYQLTNATVSAPTGLSAQIR